MREICAIIFYAILISSVSNVDKPYQLPYANICTIVTINQQSFKLLEDDLSLQPEATKAVGHKLLRCGFKSELSLYEFSAIILLL